MKRHFIQSIFVLALALCILEVAHARSVKDEDLRTRILFDAEQAGISTSNIWLRVDSNRKQVQLGGSVPTTNNIFALFSIIASVGSVADTISNVSQSVRSPQGPNPFPSEFLTGYQPPSKNAKKKSLHSVLEEEAPLYVALSQSLAEQLILQATNAPKEFAAGQLVVEGSGEDIGVVTRTPLPPITPAPPPQD